MSSIKIYVLIKFSDAKYLNRLQKEGEIYMNTVNWFKEFESNEQRKDIDEGIIRLEQISKMKLKTPDGKEFIFSKEEGPNILLDSQLKINSTEPLGNIYSLFAIYKTEDQKVVNIEIDKRNTEFGDSLLIIYDVNEFLERLFRKMDDLGFQYQCASVQYYNSKEHNGPLNVFYKPDLYQHQREFRIHIKNKSHMPICFSIGSIEDISYMVKREDFDKIVFKPL